MKTTFTVPMTTVVVCEFTTFVGPITSPTLERHTVHVASSWDALEQWLVNQTSYGTPHPVWYWHAIVHQTDSPRRYSGGEQRWYRPDTTRADGAQEFEEQYRKGGW